MSGRLASLIATVIVVTFAIGVGVTTRAAGDPVTADTNVIQDISAVVATADPGDLPDLAGLHRYLEGQIEVLEDRRRALLSEIDALSAAVDYMMRELITARGRGE